jgi:phytoene/squalene synthetase
MSAWIQTQSRVFEYPDAAAAARALPRLRRADASARVLPAGAQFAVLKATMSTQVVLQERRRLSR